MLKTSVTIIFIFCSILSIYCEFALSYPTLMYNDITSLISEISFLLPFLQVLTFMAGLYLIFLIPIPISEYKPATKIINEDKNLGKFSLEEFEIEKINVEKIINSLNNKINNSNVKKNQFETALWALCNEFQLSQGLIYRLNNEILNLEATFAFIGDKNLIENIELGVGITGQAAKNKEMIYIQDVPKGYLKVVSGLGEAYPDYVLIAPIKNEINLFGMVELCGMGKLNTQQIETIIQIANSLFTKLLTK